MFRLEMIPIHTLDALELTFDSLTTLAATLTEEQWKTPTLLPGWSVQDNYSHLIALERMLQGLPATEHRSPKFDYIKHPFGATNENEVDSRRHLSGAQVFAEWQDIVAVRMSTLRTADAAYFAQDTMTPTGPGTMAEFLHMRVLDCWMHEQDVRRALDIPGHEHGPAAELTIDRLSRSIPIVVGKRAATPEGNSVVIVLNGPVERRIIATVIDGRAQLGTEGNIAATITMDSDTFVQLAGGRLTYDDVRSMITCEGDIELATRIVTQFTMMI
jgi:uncharacterized protein (TIGR03083 family)